MASNDIDQKLNEGIAAARRGDKATARRLLNQVIQRDPRNELAWIWMASVSATLSERREALERVLRINPDNDTARQALNELGGARASTSRSNNQRRNDGGFNPRNLLLGFLVAMVIVAGLAGISIINQQNPDPTPTRPPVSLEPTPFIPPTPRSIIVTLGGDRNVPTLPPTWTPTWTPTPSETPFPTATPFPLDEFELYYTSLESGASSPDLYRVSAEGGESTLIAEDVRDVAIDPGGLRIAFVRDVTYPADEEAGTEAITAPELFIADLDDIENATQITELRTTVVASPTWSPEGRELVFVANLDGDDDLYYITPDGENLRPITDNEWSDRDPAWSPEFGSRQIVFASEGGTLLQYEIYTFDIPEPNIEPEINQLTDAADSSFSPRWSDDATRIVFVSDRRGDADVYVMRANGQGETLLTSGDGDAEDRNPVLSPDARWVAFASNRGSENFQTYLLSLDGTILLRLTENSRNDISFDFSPNRDATFGG